ncbi:hypothetical protein B0T25DRAFT_290330 [Lasiosphaeria hispida]|uniref:F-box domain-containing protein n=1 Tax=Lasiosphaeria hispida TaxID=260671 RepID=A0AAJ0HC69_9PEZI|nr:hypothetical protein B0T25DRAFT_290330 [Lasiosphaeria hispida]
MESLPTELVLEIPQHLDSLGDLASLARTCRRFYQTLNQALYRRDAESGDPVAPFWGAEKGVVNTLHHASVAGADLSQSRVSWRPWSDMANPHLPTLQQPTGQGRAPAGAADLHYGASFLERGNVTAPQVVQYWWHPLDLAAFSGRVQVIRYLASVGVDVSSSSSKGLCKFQCIPEMAAAADGRGIPIGRPFDWAIHTALQIADCAGHQQAARVIRELGGCAAALGQRNSGSSSSPPEGCGASTPSRGCRDDSFGGRQKVLAESSLFSFYDSVLERF